MKKIKNDVERSIEKMKRLVKKQIQANMASEDIHKNPRYLVWNDTANVEVLYHFEITPLNAEIFDNLIAADIHSHKLILEFLKESNVQHFNRTILGRPGVVYNTEIEDKIKYLEEIYPEELI